MRFTETKPPKPAKWLLRKMSLSNEKIAIAGDVEEEFYEIADEKGAARAKFWYLRQILILIVSYTCFSIYWRFIMFKNYFKIALRNVVKYKGYSFINISGLAIGMACFILIFLWVQDELSFDKFHENAPELYRINTRDSENPDVITHNSSFALAPGLKEQYPQIAAFTRWWFYGNLVKYKDKVFKTHFKFRTADPAIFEMFTFPFIKGDPKTALTNLNSVVITQETAKKIFGNEEPMGKVLIVDNEREFTVTGVLKNIPRNSHLQFDYLAHIELMPKERLQSWEMVGDSYVMLQKNTSVEDFNRKIANFYRTRPPGPGINIDTTYEPYLQPFTKIHLYEFGWPGRIKQVYIFSIIALFILFVACINFMNLATARSGCRAKEVGLRKVVGAQRGHIVRQFLGESIVLSFIALLFAVILVELLLPFFNNMLGKQTPGILSGNPVVLLSLAGITIITGIIAGSYPALFLSSFQPVKVLKGALNSGVKSSLFRTILVVAQFFISIVLIICTIIVYQQLNYILSRNLGYNKDYVISLPINNDYRKNYESFKNELIQNHGVSYVTAASSLPTQVGQGIGINWKGNPDDEELSVRFLMVDFDFIEAFDMKIVHGRSLSKTYATDAAEAYILNEKAVKLMGLESPLGTRVSFGEGLRFEHKGIIVGVVKDFHFRYLYEEVGPFLLRIYPPWFEYLFVKMKPENILSTINHVEKISKKYAPDYPFEYSFLDDSLDELYKSERQMGRIFNYFAFLAIFISCLGLFGLAAYMAEQRSKEISVRKVLGASVQDVVLLLSREFIKWVVIANVFAWPVAYFIMNKWLQDFAYRTNINGLVFLFSSLLTIFVAIITVIFQAVKAATANPVDALKYE